MIAFFILIILGGVITRWLNSLNNNNKIGATILIYLLILMIFTLPFGVISQEYINKNYSDFAHKPTIEVNRVNIKLMKDKIGGIDAKFELSFKEMQSELYYYFYVKKNDSTFYLKKLNSKYVKIVETNSVNPCVIKYKKEIDWENTPQRYWLLKIENVLSRYNWIIYVPKNTIIVK